METVKELLSQIPLLNEAAINKMTVAGVYVGSEIFGPGQVDLLLKKYNVTTGN